MFAMSGSLTEWERAEQDAERLRSALRNAGAGSTARLVKVYATGLGRALVEFMPLHSREIAELVDVLGRCQEHPTEGSGRR